VRGALAFFVRNWPLKLAAIGLATLLYAGLIVSASAETFQGRIPIQILNQPPDSFVIGTLDDVTTVRYLAVGADRPQVTSTSFTATVDLADVVVLPGAPPVSVPVILRAVDPRIQVIDSAPSRVAIRLDPLVTREVPIEVNLGTVPPGLDVRTPVVSPDSVTVSGPETAVRLVAVAEARVRLDPSGLDINETVSLLPVDARGEVVDGVDVQPRTTRVTVQIGSQLATRTLPINAVVNGTPGASVEIASIEVQPTLVTVEGEADALAGLVSISTRPVAISGATSDIATEVGLVLPDGVVALGVERVRVTIAMRPRTGTRTFEAGIELVNASPELAYRTAVDRILVTLGGTLQALDAIDPTRVTARVDVGGLDPGTSAVTVTIREISGVTLVSASPARVNVTASPVATPVPTSPADSSPTPAATPVTSP
jgi:YbbR domain-containing protein